MLMATATARTAINFANIAMALVKLNAYTGLGTILQIQIGNVRTIVARNALPLMKETNSSVKSAKMVTIFLKENV